MLTMVSNEDDSMTITDDADLRVHVKATTYKEAQTIAHMLDSLMAECVELKTLQRRLSRVRRLVEELGDLERQVASALKRIEAEKPL